MVGVAQAKLQNQKGGWKDQNVTQRDANQSIKSKWWVVGTLHCLLQMSYELVTYLKQSHLLSSQETMWLKGSLGSP